MPTNLDIQKAPYFDDYNEQDRYLRILFQPGRPVQTRELNGIQSILQNQIERFASNILKNGSRVVNGGVELDKTYHFVKVPDALSSNDKQTYIGGTIENDNGLVATIVNVVGAENNDPDTLYVNYQTSGDEGDGDTKQFAQGETLNIDFASGTESIVSGETGMGSAVQLSDGIYYINGEFHLVEAQTLILSKYSNVDQVPKISVGLVVDENVVTVQDDDTLRDNAFGAKGYGAPGADRYRAVCVLVRSDNDVYDTSSYVEIMSIQYGNVASSARTTDLSVIEQTLARRTYDESGDYVVEDFSPEIKQHIKNSRYPDGLYDEAEGGSADKLAMVISDGKAYVRGFEVETKVNTILPIDKARSTDSVNNVLVSMQLGNFLYVDSPYSRPTLYNTINLYSGNLVNGGQEPNNQIGFARIKNFTYSSIDQKFKVYLFDINIDPDKSFSDVRSVFQDSTAFSANINLRLSSSDGENTQLIRSNERAPIYQMPFGVVSAITSSFHNYWRLYDATVSSGTVSLSVSSGSQFRDERGDYIVTTLSGSNVFPTRVNVDTASGNTNVTITLPDNSYSNGDNVRVFARLQRNQSIIRTKTPTQKEYTAQYANGLKDFKLDKPDAFEIISVKGNTNNPVDYTNRYILDTGQRDTHYALSRVKLKGSETEPTEDLIVTFRYYEHSAGDFFTVDSYLDSDIEYADIPVYTSTNNAQYPLANCIDARPTINSDGESYSVSSIFDPDGEANVDYDYYLSRKDKVVVDKNGVFSVVSGIPSRNPVEPNEPDSALTLYDVSIPAYTFSINDVAINKINNRRYTMADIGTLERRIRNLEYYTSLSLLETKTLNQGFEDRFKSGFIADNFETQSIMDNQSPYNRIAVDFANNEARPIGTTKNVEFRAGDTSNVRNNNGKIITLPYSEIEYIAQPYASEIQRLNPFLLAGWYGQLTLNPSSDTWISTNQRPSVTLDGGTVESVRYQEAKDSLGTVWNSWETSWTGTKKTTSNATNQNITDVRWSNGNLVADYSTKFNNNSTQRIGETRSGTRTTETSRIETKYIGNKMVAVSAVPYIRSRKILFSATGLKPNTQVYAFFDGVDVTDYCNGPLKTNSIGEIQGTFVIPNDSDIKFTTGNKKMFVTDSVVGDVGTTYAKAVYSATGVLKEYQKEFVSTRVLDVETESLSDSRTRTINSNSSNVKDATTGSYGRIKTRTNSGGDSDNYAKETFYVPFIPDENGNGVGYFTFDFSTVGELRDDNRNKNGRYYYGSDDEPTGFRIFDANGNKIFDDYIVKHYFYRYKVDRASKAGTFTIEVYSEATPKHGWWKYKLKYTELTGRLPQNSCYTDPLAQSFAIDTDGGAFMTGIGVYLGPVTRATRAPVRLQVRNMVNGYPGQEVVPFTDVTVSANNIRGSEDASVETRFNFDAPVYLEEGREYCFVLLTASETLTTWIATLGQQTKSDVAINGTPRITKQPYLGSMFSSQNNRTWTANQNSDIKFRTYRASFATGTRRMTFDKYVSNPQSEVDPYYQIITLQPFTTTQGSNIVRVYHQNHGFEAGDKVTFGAIDNKYVTSINGIPYTEIFNKELTVLDNESTGEKIDPDVYFVKTASKAATAGRTGGGNVTATQNVGYSILHLLADTIQTNNTNVEWDYQGFSRTNGALDNSKKSIEPNTNIELNDQYVSVSANDGRMVLGATLSSSQENLSPIIDLERVSAICTENKISGETDIDGNVEGYTGYARYIMKTVQLENPANELKVILDANRPSGTNIDVFYKIQYPGVDGTLDDEKWNRITPDAVYPADSDINTRREYQFTTNTSKDFQTYVIKVVCSSNQKHKVPVFKDLRGIALKTISEI